MANYQTNAEVTLSVNGRQAAQMFSDLQKRAEDLRKKISAAAQAGDNVTLKKLNKELNQTERVMTQLTQKARTTDEVLRQLDTASPKELRKALRHLTMQLGKIPRGSKTWDEHAEKIRKVKAELASLNAELQPQLSYWERLKGGMKDFASSSLGAAASATAVVAGVKGAVDAFVSLDAEMANTRKYTGMSAADVEKLNGELQKIDTRTSIEGLHQLAQEAGRLGKTSQEDILGFVRASDKINVALDELGEGATLELSKLTQIFGDEERLGTEKALLSVGSVINELSQNCSASAPYIAEFAQRMGGVAAQANMSAQQVMAFGAVLDVAGQNVEASSTALSQVIVRIYRDPAKYAAVAGLDVQKFSEQVKTDMNGALLTLLETLKNAGGMDTLSPLLADMGENGSRAIQTLSALAQNIDQVRAQQSVANEAFREGTSVLKEFDEQNNTVEARLEKAKNRFHMLAASVGAELLPAINLCISGANRLITVAMGAVKMIPVLKYGLVALVGAWALYNAATALATVRTKAWIAMQAIWKGAVGVGKGAMLLFSAAISALSGNLGRATQAMRIFSATLASTGWGAVVVGIGIAIGAITNYISKNKEAREEEARLAEERKKAKAALTDIGEASKRYAEEELSKLRALYQAATNETLARKERMKAAQELQKLYPKAFANMSAEQIMLGKAKKAYDDLTQSIIQMARAKAIAEKIKENESKLIELELKLGEEREKFTKADKEFREKNNRNIQRMNRGVRSRTTMAGAMAAAGGGLSAVEVYENTSDSYNRRQSAMGGIGRTKREMREIQNANKKLAKMGAPSLIAQQLTGGADTTPTFTPSGGGGSSSGSGGGSGKGDTEADRRKLREAKKETEDFKQEMDRLQKEWDQADVFAVLERESGNATYAQTLDARYKAARDYYDKMEKLYKEKVALGENDDLTEDSDYRELLKKREKLDKEQSKTVLGISERRLRKQLEIREAEIESEYRASDMSLAAEKKRDDDLIAARTEMLKEIRSVYDADSEEWRRVDKELEETQENDKLARRKRYIELARGYLEEIREETDEERIAREKSILEELVKLNLISEEAKQKYLDKQNADAAKKRRQEHESLPGKESSPRGNTEELKKKYDQEKEDLDKALKEKEISQEEYNRRLKNLDREYWKGVSKNLKDAGDDWGSMILDVWNSWKTLFEDLKSGNGDWASNFANAIEATAAVTMTAMQLVTQFYEEEEKIRLAKMEKRYQKEKYLAEGNTYLLRKLERKRAAEEAAIKNKASRQQFAMQVVQATAQSIIAGLNAYSSTLAIPAVGKILAPIAMATALATGAAQVALLKKQQQAAESTGYAQGGFTAPGPRDKEVGVVHAGEWVAPQSMVNDPGIRPVIDALEYARRTNTRGMLRPVDVSRNISPSVFVPRAPEGGSLRDVASDQREASGADAGLQDVISRLSDRLDEPFFTVNTVTGAFGSKRAEDEYNRLMRNKTPKRRRP